MTKRSASPPAEPPVDVWLGDLFDSYTEPPPVRRASRLPWLGRLLVQTVGVSIGAAAAFLVAGYRPPLLIIVPAAASLILMFRAWRMAVEPDPGRTAAIVRKPDPVWRSGFGLRDEDRMRDAVRRWERRLEWGATDPARFRASVAGQLAEVAEERLRQRYGFTSAQDPDRARSLLGSAGWQILYGSGNPTARELAAFVARLESL